MIMKIIDDSTLHTMHDKMIFSCSFTRSIRAGAIVFCPFACNLKLVIAVRKVGCYSEIAHSIQCSTRANNDATMPAFKAGRS